MEIFRIPSNQLGMPSLTHSLRPSKTFVVKLSSKIEHNVLANLLKINSDGQKLFFLMMAADANYMLSVHFRPPYFLAKL